MFIDIVTHCTNRKKLQPPDELRLRKLPARAISERAHLWCEKLRNSSANSLRAVDLYSGDHWSIVRELPAVAESKGTPGRLWIVSAGYGLLTPDSLVHPYSATFACGHPDSVIKGSVSVSRNPARQEWWELLGKYSPISGSPKNLFGLFAKHPSHLFLIILPTDYLQAVEEDLVKAIGRLTTGQAIILSTETKVDQRLSPHVVRINARLQAVLAGSRMSLLARTCRRIIQNLPDCSLHSVRCLISELLRGCPALPKYDRRPMEDDEVKAFIRKNLSKPEGRRHTPLLKKFRGANLACEQGRFRNLYREVRSENEAVQPNKTSQKSNQDSTRS